MIQIGDEVMVKDGCLREATVKDVRFPFVKVAFLNLEGLKIVWVDMKFVTKKAQVAV